jgi:hypothetical protein
MAEFDHGVKRIAQEAGRQLARLADIACTRLHPLEGTLPATTELIADRAIWAARGRERFVVYFEFFTTWNRHAPWGLLAKSGLLAERERLPVVCVVLVLQPRGYRPQQGRFRLEACGGPTQQAWFREICLWKVKPETWWEQSPALMTLFPLSCHGLRPAEAVRHAASVIELQVEDPAAKADGLFFLSIFGELAYPRLDVSAIVGREKMKTSRFVREMREEEREVGRQEGLLAARHQDVLEALEARFSSEARTSLEAAITRIADAEHLRRLVRAAATCKSLDEFRAALTSNGAPRS